MTRVNGGCHFFQSRFFDRNFAFFVGFCEVFEVSNCINILVVNVSSGLSGRGSA